MRKLWRLAFLWGLLGIVSMSNVSLSAASTSPQMALMYVRSKGNDQYDSYFSIVEIVGNKLTEVEHTLVNTVYAESYWAPRAKSLLYVQEVSETESVLIIKDTNGTNAIDFPYKGHNKFELSPDGKHILRIDADSNDYPYIAYFLTLIDLDGKQRTLFSTEDNEHEDNLLTDPIEYMSSVRWSSDGAYIALYGARADDLEPGSIYLISTDCLDALSCTPEKLRIIDGSGTRLSETSEHGYEETWRSPVWSPDSERLAFNCALYLCLLNRDGTKFQRLPHVKNFGDRLDWSPDGRYLTYECVDKNSNYDICIVDLQMNREENLTNTPDINEYYPVWLTWPDAEFLAE